MTSKENETESIFIFAELIFEGNGFFLRLYFLLAIYKCCSIICGMKLGLFFFFFFSFLEKKKKKKDESVFVMFKFH